MSEHLSAQSTQDFHFLSFSDFLTEEEEEHRRDQNKLKYLMSVCFPGAEESDDIRDNRRLPYWCVHIAYGLCIATSVIAILFVILYGFQFGRMKSDEWIVTMVWIFMQNSLLHLLNLELCLASGWF